MKPEEKRIFISDLPETASKDEIETKFQKYGIVKTVEIKERKELGPKNTSLFFSYVNIDIDDSSLQKCFKDFRQNKWHGNFVELQIARESFLDRLKREREAQNKINEEKDKNSDSNLVNLKHNINDSSINTVLKSSKKIRKITEFEQNKEEPPEKIKKINIVCETFESDTNGEKITDAYKDLNIKIVNNKGKSLENGLKIQSFGKPILEINNLKKVKVKPKSESDLKRIESLNRMKKGYNAQKMIIQSALAKIDNKNGKVGNFNETISKQEEKSKKRLFGDESDDEEIGNVFQIKEHFQGKKGQQLLQLQSRYKNDERFKLDSRFLDEHLDEKEEVEDLDTDEEKKKQFEILEQVIGRKVNSTEPEQKGMLRFDPSQPQHAKYELKKSEKLTKNKKKQRKVSESNEIVEPLVSKEVFYKVSDNLKETFQENKPFSLLDTFGETTKEEEYEPGESASAKPISGFSNGPNPFRYESSDDEIEYLNKTNTSKTLETTNAKPSTKLWQEPFFFKTDDYRLLEGFEFVQRINASDTEFSKIRAEVKNIVRAKVRNNLRKNKLFKKKLGGNKLKKKIRMKKALNR